MAVRAPVALTAAMLLASMGCLTTTISGMGSAGNAGATSSGTAGATGSSSGGAGTTSGTGTGGRVSSGPCTVNDQCISGVCGIDGTGCCCSAACSIENPICGATACDCQTGACVYPLSGGVCDDLACSGDSLRVPFCNGKGDCVPTTTGSCAPYACGDAGCITTCETTTQCATGFFCDSLNATCCSGLAASGTIEANSQLGDDAHACCGIGKNPPCQTITQAMRLIDSAQARDVIIDATVFSDGGFWDVDGNEAYPIVLGWGAELNVPGVVFGVPVNLQDDPPSEIFDIKSYSPSDTAGYASIAGGSGFSAAIDAFDIDATAIQVERGSHLYLANMDLYMTNGIDVLPLASLTLGQDRSALVRGTVTIGVKDPFGGPLLGENIGILCFSDDAGNGCTIDDAALDGGSSVIIQNQLTGDIVAGDGASISLTSAPIMGVAPAVPGFRQCPSTIDTQGEPVSLLAAISLQGKATMTFENGTVQCIQNLGFGLTPSEIGSPSLTVLSSVIQNTSGAIVANAGSLTVASSTIRFNGAGVEVFYDAGADLSGGQFGGVNTLACNFGDVGTSGSVLSYGIKAVNASNVAWDTPGPNVFIWSDEGGGYVCVVSGCTVLGDAGTIFDAVSTRNSPQVITTGNTLSLLQCE